MNKTKLIFLLLPLLITSCGGGQGGQGSNSGTSGDEGSGSIIPIDDLDEYDEWLNSWSQPNHLYFHYNRGKKGGYENYCLWLWQHAPQDLEGSLWGFPKAQAQVSEKLTLKPMSEHWMTNAEAHNEKGEASEMYIDDYGVIMDVDMGAEKLVGGKTGTPTTFDDMEELGFLLPLKNSMTGITHWASDGGNNTYIEDIGEAKNWRDVEGGKAIHIFVSTGDFDNYTYYVGSGTPQAKINPIDEDTTGQYRSDADAKYSNALGNSSTSDTFKSLGTGYQIFVASFRDSDGDGMGDLRGVINSLDYLSDLGVEALWLTPIQKSDSYHGYDISDYYAVDKRFGTIEDYRELLYKAHQKGMKVLMDLVLNHTSKSNVWFTNSRWGKVDAETGIKWRDVYSWKYETDMIEKYFEVDDEHPTAGYYPITVKKDAESTNPSWYRDGESHYYYYGKFGSGMPEINYLNDATRKIVIDMAKYWMSFGLDGFRLDAVKHIFMRDECFQAGDIIIKDTGSKTAFDDEKGDYFTKAYDYSSNLTKNVMWWKEFAHGVKSDYPNCFLVGENFDGWGTRVSPYYQALDSQFSFSTYYHIPYYLFVKDGGAANFKTQAGETFVPYAAAGNVSLGDNSGAQQIPGGNRPDFIDGAFTSNHDVMRAINQANGVYHVSDDGSPGSKAIDNVDGSGDQVNKAKIHAALTLLNPGLSWIYYGDELGMSSNLIVGGKTHKEIYGSENCEDIWYRQPFLWKDSTIRTGYKSGQYKFELDDYNKTLHDAETQMTESGSMYNWYKDLIRIKKMYPKGAKLEFHSYTSGNVLVLKVMDANGNPTMAIFINIGWESDYQMNPDAVVGATTKNEMTMGGAPSEKGGDIGHKPWSVSVFVKE